MLRFRQNLLLTLETELDGKVKYWFVSQKEKQSSNLRHAERRRKAVREVYFNIDVFLNKESLRLFRFRLSELGKISALS